MPKTPKTPKKKTKKAEPDLKSEIDKSVKMFEVAKPGETPASATSRPIIVNHGAMIKKDPMVREEDTPEQPEKPAKAESHGETVIAPIAKTSKKKAETSAPELPLAEEESKTDEVLTPQEEPVEELAKPVNEEDELVSDEAAKEDKADAKDKEHKEDDALAARIKEAEKSIQSKEFFVPLGKVSRRRSKNRLLFLLFFVIIAGAVFLNFAVDAGIIDIGVKPFTNLF